MAVGETPAIPTVCKPKSERERGRPPQGGVERGEAVKTNSGYGDGPAYWDERYRKDRGTYEWVGQWQDVAATVCAALEGKSRDQLQILHAGCGNSELAEGMYHAGFRHITSIDNSAVVIEQMARRSAEMQLSELRWACMDAAGMELPDWSFDVVLDKCLIDALACADDKDLQLASYLKEVIRILRPDGIFICVSLNSARVEHLKAEPWCFHLVEVAHLDSSRVCICRKTQASDDFLARWPEIHFRLERGLSEIDLELVDADGLWAPAEQLEAGDVVEVATAFQSGDEPEEQVSLPAGLRGIVRVVDDEGDAVVRFPRLPNEQRVDRFVLQAQLANLRKRLPLAALAPEGA